MGYTQLINLKTLLFLITTLLFFSGNAQELSTDQNNNSNPNQLYHYDSVFKIALSFYPSLASEKIQLKMKAINSTARTTISLSSVFKKVNKQYYIFINEDKDQTGMLLSDAPIEAQIGLFGHELAHVLDFKKRSFLDLTWWGISYLFDRHRPKIEKKADKTAIQHGLGQPLYSFTDFVLNHSTANEKYLKMKKINYLLPQEILDYMKQNGY